MADDDYSQLARKIRKALDDGATDITMDLHRGGESSRVTLNRKGARDVLVWLEREIEDARA